MPNPALNCALLLAICCLPLGCAADVSSAEEEAVEEISQPVAFTSEYVWVQNFQPLTQSMTSTSNSICFLTYVSGRFEGSGEKVHITQQGGIWRLGGESKQLGVGANARCVTGVALNDTTEEFVWRQGVNSGSVRIKDRSGTDISASSWSCFLTRMEGNFDGSGEEIRVRSGSTHWVIEGFSQQNDVAGGARCIRRTRHADQIWNMGQTSPTGFPNADPNDGDVCFLRGVKGSFANFGASMGTGRHGATWQLSGMNAETNDFQARGGCLE